MDVVIITPEPGKQKEIGQKLLALADNPRDVQWVTWPKAGYSIPLALFMKFDAEDIAEALWQMPVDELEKLVDEQPRRRRGRPRKEEPSTDNNTSEGE